MDQRGLIESDLRLIEAVTGEIDALEKVLREEAWQNPRVRLLTTIPGVDFCVALTLIAALGELSRFKDGNHAASYLGLTPSVKQSANTCYHGSITKRGNTLARWMLTQAAQHMARHPGPLGVFFRRLAKRKCWNIAVCATARKLVNVAWLMLNNNEPYRYATPTTTQQKLSRMRVAVTGNNVNRNQKRQCPNSLPTPAAGSGEPPASAGKLFLVAKEGEICEIPTLTHPEVRCHAPVRSLQLISR